MGFPEPAPVGEAGLRAESPVHQTRGVCQEQRPRSRTIRRALLGMWAPRVGGWEILLVLLPGPHQPASQGFYHPLPAGRPGSGRPACPLGSALDLFPPFRLAPDSH